MSHITRSTFHISYEDEKGNLHREDGPAFQYTDSGSEYWSIHGKYHRKDGPAVILRRNPNEEPYSQKWYFDGKKIDCKTNEEFLQLMKMKAFW